MPILGIMASSITASTLGDYQSIATVTVGSGGQAEIDFTSIPGTYQHLQLRYLGRYDGSSADGDVLRIRFNGVSTSDYAYHSLFGNGASASSNANTTQNLMISFRLTSATQGASTFGAAVIDILDYANTNKYTTIRSLGGYDNNGSGFIGLNSGLFMKTDSVSSIKLFSATSFVQHSSFSLYGIKG
jgi:hypothetical protein